PGRPPRRRALPAAVRHDRDDAGVRRRGSGRGPPPRGAGQGLGHRDDLHLRRPERRDLVAGAAAADPRDRGLGRPAAARCPGRRPGRALRRARRQDRVQRAAADGGAAARVRRPRGRPEADHAPGEVLREGRAPARDRHDPPVVHPQRRPGRRPARGPGRPRPRDPVGARAHAVPLRELGRGPQRRLADQPAALLRRPVPGLVPARRGRGARLLRAAAGAGGVAAGRPVLRRPGRVHRGPARRARRVHGRPRRHGHLGDLVAVAAGGLGLGHRPGAVRRRLPDGPAPAGARHHPHLAVLDGGPLALRVRDGAVVARGHLGLRRRPRPQEDVEVQGQRDDADRRARALRHRRRPLAGRRCAPGCGLAVRRDADEGRPPAGDEDPQRRQVRAGPGRLGVLHGRAGHRADRPRPAHRARPRGRRGDGGDGGLQLHPRARGQRDVLLVVLRRLRGAGEVARLRLRAGG
ncbi:MAG: Valyl-tRNA synthetase, partial [uncultured Nocardioidaceae bacterium]